MTVHDLPTTSNPTIRTPGTPSLMDYTFSLPYWNRTIEPNAAGVKEYGGSYFADVEVEGKTHHAFVQFDESINTYRLKKLTELESGPAIYRSIKNNLWKEGRHLTFLDSERHTFSESASANGFHEVRNAGAASDAPIVAHAYRDHNHRWVEVDLSQPRDTIPPPVKLAHWTDGDLRQMYNLTDAQLLEFRAEADTSGNPPSWVTRIQHHRDHEQVTESLRWIHPTMPLKERRLLLRSYNLTASQLKRLRTELEGGQMPAWAEEHKRMTMNKDDDQRFKLIAEELEHHVQKLRTLGSKFAHGDPTYRYSKNFLADYTARLGYLRNTYDVLYRTDIPAMFRGETRTPFELSRDRRMIHRKGNPSGTTSKRAFSATFGLNNATRYAATNGGFFHELHYNSQANLHPGINPDARAKKRLASDESDSDDNVSQGRDWGGGYDSDDSTVSNEIRAGDESDSDSSFVFDDTRNYTSMRRKQTTSFVYAIDTRGVEVVPGHEEIALNNKARFMFDELEGHISMPTRGVSAERIWLVRSDLGRAARVDDIYAMAETNNKLKYYEKSIWAGTDFDNHHRRSLCDGLIDEIASSGGVVLELPKGELTFADDIIWPVPEHYRT
ncbi:hypothetical protein ACIOWE_11430 [Pseudomonas sp. NPDC087598]|uniref:hypothetical protein n=1 Tax=Pseudomonas sp. NPDC087598 TaxID=3364440 RepID=UPI003808D8A9